MNLDLKKLYTAPKIFQRSVGLTIGQFEILSKDFVPAFELSIGKSGRNYKYESQNLLLIYLIYYKTYLTQEFLGFLIDLSQSNLSRLFKRINLLIEDIADPELKDYVAKLKEAFDQISASDRINDWQKFCKSYPDLKEIITDTTEQQVDRSKNNDIQKKDYSGKKKRHTIKTQITISRFGRILDVSKSYPGSVHDKSIIDQEKTVQKFPKKTSHNFDLGFQGITAENPDHNLKIPHKKPKGKPLDFWLKKDNQKHSKIRVVVEHAFARMKSFKILKNAFRGTSESYNQTFRNIAALLNFRMKNARIL